MRAVISKSAIDQFKQLCRRLDDIAFRFMVMTVLFFGALGPAFRTDETSKYVSICCVIILTVLAGITIFRRQKSGDRTVSRE
jgi:hypothetical protein